MQHLGDGSHLKQVLRWSPQPANDWGQVLAAAIGMAAPVLVAGAAGHLAAGLAAAVGGLMLGTGGGAGRSARRLLGTLAPALAAIFVAWLIAGHGLLSDLVQALIAGAAVTIGGFSRPLAGASTRFVLFLVIVTTVAGPMAHEPAVAVLIVAGALWTALLLALFSLWFKPAQAAIPVAAIRQVTAARRFARWRRSLAQAQGWHFATRLTVCLAVAGLLRWIWPEHHLHWIALTIVLLSERDADPLPVKTTQRAAGVAIGVVFAGMLLAWHPPLWGLTATLAVLAGARPMLRERNYLAYSVITTPLIILILDAGHPAGMSILIDRLVATLAGAALVILATFAFRWMQPVRHA